MTALLLDTHIAIWLATDPVRVPNSIRKEVSNADRRYISAVSFAEVALKHRKNPTGFPFTSNHLEQALFDLRAIELPLYPSHVKDISRIPLKHKDPFDHLLMAQALSEGCPLVTLDTKILGYRLKGLQLKAK